MVNHINKELSSFIKTAKSLDRNKKIKFIILYGSYAKDKNNKMSDIDICVYYNDNPKNSFKFRKKLLGLLNQKYDVQIFQNLPLYVKKEVLSGKILYSKNRRFLYDTAYKTIRDFDHFKKCYYDYISRNRVSTKRV